MTKEEEERQYQLGYKSGMRMGKDLGTLRGEHSMLSRVIETIEEMHDITYAQFNKNTLADHLLKELQDED